MIVTYNDGLEIESCDSLPKLLRLYNARRNTTNPIHCIYANTPTCYLDNMFIRFRVTDDLEDRIEEDTEGCNRFVLSMESDRDIPVPLQTIVGQLTEDLPANGFNASNVVETLYYETIGEQIDAISGFMESDLKLEDNFALIDWSTLGKTGLRRVNPMLTPYRAKECEWVGRNGTFVFVPVGGHNGPITGFGYILERPFYEFLQNQIRDNWYLRYFIKDEMDEESAWDHNWHCLYGFQSDLTIYDVLYLISMTTIFCDKMAIAKNTMPEIGGAEIILHHPYRGVYRYSNIQDPPAEITSGLLRVQFEKDNKSHALRINDFARGLQEAVMADGTI